MAVCLEDYRRRLLLRQPARLVVRWPASRFDQACRERRRVSCPACVRACVHACVRACTYACMHSFVCSGAAATRCTEVCAYERVRVYRHVYERVQGGRLDEASPPGLLDGRSAAAEGPYVHRHAYEHECRHQLGMAPRQHWGLLRRASKQTTGTFVPVGRACRRRGRYEGHRPVLGDQAFVLLADVDE